MTQAKKASKGRAAAKTAASPMAQAASAQPAQSRQASASQSDAQAASPQQPVSSPADLLTQLLASIQAEHDRHPGFPGVSQQIEQAVKLSNEQVSSSAGDIAYAQRVCTEAFAAGLRHISDAQHRQRMQLLQEAATAVCLEAMLKSPERADDYSALLDIIKRVV